MNIEQYVIHSQRSHSEIILIDLHKLKITEISKILFINFMRVVFIVRFIKFHFIFIKFLFIYEFSSLYYINLFRHYNLRIDISQFYLIYLDAIYSSFYL